MNRHDDDQDPIAGESLPRIKPGDYDAVCYKVGSGRGYGGRKDIYIQFRITEGEHEGVELFMACTNYGKKIKPRCKYYIQWTIAKGRSPEKGERLSRNIFLNRLYRIRVRDTMRKYKDGTSLPDCVQYSVVESILAVLVGDAPE